MEKSRTKKIAFYGVFSALILVLFYFETLLSFALTITPPAILSLPVIMTFCLMHDYKTGFVGGLIFGVSSFVIALSISNPVFILPWVSILPRLFVGISAFGACAVIKQLFKNRQNKFLKTILPYSVGAFVGIFVNTALTIVCLSLFVEGGFAYWFELCVTINFPIELVVAVILTPILTKFVDKVKGRIF